MSTHALPSVRTARDAVLELLEPISSVIDIFSGEVDEDQIRYDSDDRVHGYAVLWAGAGTLLTNRLCMTPDAKQFGFQITAAGGDDTRALWVADRVNGVLVGARLSIPDGKTTPITGIGDEGPVRIDNNVTPTRHFVPLLFTCRLA